MIDLPQLSRRDFLREAAKFVKRSYEGVPPPPLAPDKNKQRQIILQSNEKRIARPRLHIPFQFPNPPGQQTSENVTVLYYDGLEQNDPYIKYEDFSWSDNGAAEGELYAHTPKIRLRDEHQVTTKDVPPTLVPATWPLISGGFDISIAGLVDSSNPNIYPSDVNLTIEVGHPNDPNNILPVAVWHMGEIQKYTHQWQHFTLAMNQGTMDDFMAKMLGGYYFRYRMLAQLPKNLFGTEDTHWYLDDIDFGLTFQKPEGTLSIHLPLITGGSGTR